MMLYFLRSFRQLFIPNNNQFLALVEKQVEPIYSELNFLAAPDKILSFRAMKKALFCNAFFQFNSPLRAGNSY